MGQLYTKRGRPLQVSGDKLYSRSGTYIGRISGKYVYGTSGRYAGTIVGNRVVYRGADAGRVGSASSSAARVGTARAYAVGSAISGEEPDFPA